MTQKPTDFKGLKSKEDKSKFWHQELQAGINYWANWVVMSDRYNVLYRNDPLNCDIFNEEYLNVLFNGTTTYNIFNANVSTLMPILYSNTPKVDVRRRFFEKDKIARKSAELLERNIDYCVDSYDFDSEMKRVVIDALVTGRAVAREIIDITTIETNTIFKDREIGNRVRTTYVDFHDFITQPSRRWEEVQWIAFRNLYSYDEVVERFGEEIAKCLSFDKLSTSNLFSDTTYQYSGYQYNNDSAASGIKFTEIWEIWNKAERKILHVSLGYDKIIKQIDDPLKISSFFPTPKPIFFNYTNSTIIPVPDYSLYREQAEELNEVSRRITDLISQAQVGGLYNAVIGDETLSQLLNTQGTYSPVKNLAPGANIRDYIYDKPLEAIVNSLIQLYQQKQQIIENIYNITGIADIVRGQTFASETAAAQEIKSSYAMSRIAPKQQLVQDFVRDLFRIKGEIIAQHFEPETMAEIAGLKITEANSGEELDASAENTAGFTATREEFNKMIALLRDQKLRDYRIDVETDSTVQQDISAEKQKRAEFLTVLSSSLSQLLPLVTQGLLPAVAFSEILSFTLQPYKVGRNLEDAIDSMGTGLTDLLKNQQNNQQPSPEMLKLQQQAKESDQKMMIKQAELMQKQEIEEAKLAVQEQNNQMKYAVDTERNDLEEQKLNHQTLKHISSLLGKS